MNCPEQANLQRQKVDLWLPVAGGRGDWQWERVNRKVKGKNKEKAEKTSKNFQLLYLSGKILSNYKKHVISNISWYQCKIDLKKDFEKVIQEYASTIIKYINSYPLNLVISFLITYLRKKHKMRKISIRRMSL